MNTLSYKTKFANAQTYEREWFVVDATDKTLGRLATQIATVLKGKHKPTYSPHFDAGDNVIVLNADKIHLSGDKWNQKKYIRYTGYPGGQREVVAKNLNDKKPIAIVENAVRGMLPKNKLGRAMFKKLFVYAGAEHPHAAQKPQTL
ncbi:MAG: 50S ribosomal protein L13 [Bacteroidetes bacterium]|nr:50S ribosomal protein L13 [Bacteroidota bacterium]MCB9226375.1 50S ribosomal protein L13 [Chitinophagales bacterium]